MPDRFYSVSVGEQMPHLVTEGGATSGKAIELRVNSSAYASKMAVLLGLEAIRNYAITRKPPIELLSDDFNRANSGTLGANWTTVTGLESMSIDGNAIHVTNLNVETANTHNRSVGNNHYAKASVAAFSGSSDQWFSLLLRFDPATKNGYACEGGRFGGNVYGGIYRWDAGVKTGLGNFPATTWTATDVPSGQIVGNRIVFYKNGLLLTSGIDLANTYPSGKVGVQSFITSGTTQDLVLDNFSAGILD